MKTLFVTSTALLSLVWLAFAWIMLGWLGFFLQENSVKDLTVGEATVCFMAFVLGPMFLIGGWSYALQQKLPSRRQLARGVLILAMVLSAILLIGGLALLVGHLKDSTRL